MGKRVVFGGFFAILGAACGGHIDGDPGSSASVPIPSRGGDQGIYIAPSTKGPEHVADGLGTPTAIAMTDTSVLFTTRTGTISDAPVAAGALYVADKRVGPALLLTVDREGASFDGLVTDGSTAFIATSDGRVLALPVAGGTPRTVATLDAPAVALAVDGGYVYYATKSGALGRVDKKGGDLAPLGVVTGTIRGLQADASALYVANGAAGDVPAGIARVPLDGSAVKILTAGGEPCAMIRDGRRLFWTTIGASATTAAGAVSMTGQVLRLSLDGGDVATVAAGAFSACAIAADTQSLYFVTTPSNALTVKSGGPGAAAPMAGLGIMRAPIAGGPPVAVAHASGALAQPGAVAVDATHVYWLTSTAVLRLAK